MKKEKAYEWLNENLNRWESLTRVEYTPIHDALTYEPLSDHANDRFGQFYIWLVPGEQYVVLRFGNPKGDTVLIIRGGHLPYTGAFELSPEMAEAIAKAIHRALARYMEPEEGDKYAKTES